MCRNIRTLFNFEPVASDSEVRDAALQYVRKLSGMRQPSHANQKVFDRAVDEVAAASRRLMDDLVTTASPRDRDEERAKARARWEKRAERLRASG